LVLLLLLRNWFESWSLFGCVQGTICRRGTVCPCLCETTTNSTAPTYGLLFTTLLFPVVFNSKRLYSPATSGCTRNRKSWRI